MPGGQPLRGQLGTRAVRALRAKLGQGYLISEFAELAVSERLGEQQPRKGPRPHRKQSVLQRGPDIAGRRSWVAVAGQEGIGDAGQRHPAGHPRQQGSSLARRERLCAGAGRESQHRLADIGAAPHRRPGGQNPHRAARMLADPAERDRTTVMKSRYQRLQPLRYAQVSLILADGGVLAGGRAARDLGDLPRLQVPQYLPRAAGGCSRPASGWAGPSVTATAQPRPTPNPSRTPRYCATRLPNGPPLHRPATPERDDCACRESRPQL